MSWLEQVQKNAARFVCNSYNNYSVSLSELVLSLGWEALGVRRLYNQSVSFYKFHNGLVPCTPPNCTSGLGNTTSIRRHIYSLQQLHISVLAFSYSFFPRCIRMRNLLPSQVGSATSLNVLKQLPGVRN